MVSVREKYLKKLNKLEKELAKDPNNVELLFKIGMLQFDPFVNTDKARPYFEKAIELEPDNPNLYFWFGYALYRNDCAYEESKKLFEKALSLDPDRAEFYYMIFNILWNTTKNEDEYMKYLLKTMELQPDWLSPREQYIRYLIDRNRLDEAKSELKIAYSALEKMYKNNEITDINVIEKYYYEDSEKTYYKFENDWLDGLKKEIDEKKKQWDMKQKKI